MDTLQLFAAGDQEAFEVLFRRHQGEIYRWLACLVRDPAAAEDLTVETFWRVYRSHAHFDPRRDFLPWARRIAANLAMGHLQRCGRETHAGAELPDAVPGNAARDSAIQQETRKAIRLAFASLPAKLKAVATLAIIEERPYLEIAAALGITVPAVKSREFRAVRMLRRRLTEMGVEP
ncbi:MAG: sigma-70 family RNA polymerase sigma factor [Acidobacteriia bacterium]|nr:sigma-70 family RNA polymerase sigma factor [Terriglobia bacterium]